MALPGELTFIRWVSVIEEVLADISIWPINYIDFPTSDSGLSNISVHGTQDSVLLTNREVTIKRIQKKRQR
jgi:hypothetical protein